MSSCGDGSWDTRCSVVGIRSPNRGHQGRTARWSALGRWQKAPGAEPTPADDRPADTVTAAVAPPPGHGRRGPLHQLSHESTNRSDPVKCLALGQRERSQRKLTSSGPPAALRQRTDRTWPCRRRGLSARLSRLPTAPHVVLCSAEALPFLVLNTTVKMSNQMVCTDRLRRVNFSKRL